ncbi:protein spindle-F [Anopheles stephensi]|uniref:Zn-C2H2_12 domain-containing protein n=1 Tax=Anopheles stephensi TaxID=30069 RepID=A0A182XXR2_ANOST|nr:protein spindle-F [Anopheles stephensi]
MSTAEPNTQTASHQALQTALQTLKERCQTLQRRITVLEEENGTLRTLQAKSSNAPDHSQRDSRAVQQTELRQLRETVAELTHQKMQMAEQISMVDTENRQLWRRLSLIAKDLGDVEDGMNVGPSTALVNQQPKAPLATTAPSTTTTTTNQTGQNLIRSRTFTKHAPNPKLRERLQRDSSADEEDLLNLEDISLLNTCGFLDSSTVDLGQHADLLRVALEANPDISRCTEGLLDIKEELARQHRLMWDVYHRFKSELCNRCSTQSSETEREKLMKDVMVEVAESELAPRKPPATFYPPPLTAPKKGGQTGREEGSDALLFDKVSMNLLQEKLRASGMKKICPMCGVLYGEDTVFDEFQSHVESHFLHDGELDELSLDRAYEYTSQTVGDF